MPSKAEKPRNGATMRQQPSLQLGRLSVDERAELLARLIEAEAYGSVKDGKVRELRANAVNGGGASTLGAEVMELRARNEELIHEKARLQAKARLAAKRQRDLEEQLEELFSGRVSQKLARHLHVEPPAVSDAEQAAELAQLRSENEVLKAERTQLEAGHAQLKAENDQLRLDCNGLRNSQDAALEAKRRGALAVIDALKAEQAQLQAAHELVVVENSKLTAERVELLASVRVPKSDLIAHSGSSKLELLPHVGASEAMMEMKHADDAALLEQQRARDKALEERQRAFTVAKPKEAARWLEVQACADDGEVRGRDIKPATTRAACS